MTIPTFLIENSSERYEALPEACLQNELFEQTKDYLTRGRRFEMLGIDQLNDEWAKAFRLFVSRKIGLRGRDLDDAGAELRLRGAEFPTKLVTSEIERLRAAIQHIGLISSSAEFNIKIDELTSDMGKLKH